MLMEIKECQQLKFFTSNTIDIYANPLINLFLFVSDSQVLVPQLLSFDNGTNLFCSSKFN